MCASITASKGRPVRRQGVALTATRYGNGPLLGINLRRRPRAEVGPRPFVRTIGRRQRLGNPHVAVFVGNPSVLISQV